MKDKFCVSKTLTYLVVLVLAVVGTFYLTNYVNNQKLTSESEAAKLKVGSCLYMSPGRSCEEAGANYVADEERSIYDKKGKLLKTCCVALKLPVGGTVPSVSCSSKGGKWYKESTYPTCSSLGAGYTDATGVTETKDGYNCCTTQKQPTSSVVTCTSQGGLWYGTQCNLLSGSYAEVAGVTETRANKYCCKPVKAPTPTIKPI